MPVPNLAVRTTLRPRTRLASRSTTAQNSRTQQFSIPHLGSGVGGTAAAPFVGAIAALAATSLGAFKILWSCLSSAIAKHPFNSIWTDLSPYNLMRMPQESFQLNLLEAKI